MASRPFGFLSYARLRRAVRVARGFEVRVRSSRAILKSRRWSRFNSDERAMLERWLFHVHIGHSISSLRNKGFCNLDPCGAEPVAAVATRGRRPILILASPIALRVIFAAGRRPGRSIRCEESCEKGKTRRADYLRNDLPQMEPTENSVREQWLAMKARSRLRVICATPFQKRPDSQRSERFLCCVCRSLR